MVGGESTAFRGEVRVPKALFMERLPLPITTFPLMPRAHQAATDPYLVLEYGQQKLTTCVGTTQFNDEMVDAGERWHIGWPRNQVIVKILINTESQYFDM